MRWRWWNEKWRSGLSEASGPDDTSLQERSEHDRPTTRGSFDLRNFSGDAALVIGAAIIANLFSFVFHFTLSRRLGPELYGTLVTLMAISTWLGVLGQSVGTVAMQETAKMWASHLDTAIAPFLRRAGRLTLAVAALVALALVVATIPLRSYVHVMQPQLWWLLALYVAMTMFAGFARGAAQGAHRFSLFAVSMISEGVAKVAIALAFVALGFGVAGALGGLIASAAIAVTVVYAPLVWGGLRIAWAHDERLRLGGEALKVLAVTATTGALLYVDMLFAKHHFSGVQAGYFGAAGTVARTIPAGVGLVGLIVMPKAAAARHVGAEPLARVLGLAAMIAAAIVCASLIFIASFPSWIVHVTYGPTFAGAIPLLRVYALDEALFALWAVAISYLVAVASYQVFGALVVAALIEAAAMALLGSTPMRLLSIAIIVNGLLLPTVWLMALRTLRGAPQASRPPRAESAL
jgi:O-antigen/teichoic acid export membrane protein